MNDQQGVKPDTPCCLHCHTPLINKRAGSKTCSTSCRVMLSRANSSRITQNKAQQHTKRLKRFRQSMFLVTLTTQVKRSGTLQILPKDLGNLRELYRVTCWLYRANTYGQFHDYDLCHVFPINHTDFVGTLFPANIVVGSHKANASFGAKSYADSGHKLARAKLLKKYKVEDYETKAEIAERIIAFIGEDVISSLVAKEQIRGIAKFDLLEWFNENPLQKHKSGKTDEELKALSGKELSQLRASLEDTKSFVSGGPKAAQLSSMSVFQNELKRMAQHSTSCAEANAVFLNYLPAVIELFHGRTQHTKKIQVAIGPLCERLDAQFFHTLHGAPVSDLTELLEEAATLVGVPALVQSETQAVVIAVIPTPALVVAPAPAVARKPLPLPWQVQQKQPRKSFANELDCFDAINDDDDADDWQHLEVYLHAQQPQQHTSY